MNDERIFAITNGLFVKENEETMNKMGLGRKPGGYESFTCGPMTCDGKLALNSRCRNRWHIGLKEQAWPLIQINRCHFVQATVQRSRFCEL